MASEPIRGCGMTDREPFKLEPHSWGQLKALPWAVCVKCGLVKLRSPFTQWSIKHGCNNEDHPSYEAVRRKFTSPL